MEQAYTNEIDLIPLERIKKEYIESFIPKKMKAMPVPGKDVIFQQNVTKGAEQVAMIDSSMPTPPDHIVPSPVNGEVLNMEHVGPNIDQGNYNGAIEMNRNQIGVFNGDRDNSRSPNTNNKMTADEALFEPFISQLADPKVIGKVVAHLNESQRSPDSRTPTPLLPPCRVCGEKASGFHYGVNTCEACKVKFFLCTLGGI